MTRVTSSDDVTIIQRHNVIRHVINVIFIAFVFMPMCVISNIMLYYHPIIFRVCSMLKPQKQTLNFEATLNRKDSPRIFLLF